MVQVSTGHTTPKPLGGIDMAHTSYSNSTEQKALALAARSDRWSRGTARTVTGALVAVNLFASESDPGKVWLTRVDGAGCSCPGAQKSRVGVCFHMRAAALVTQRVHEAAGRAKARYDELYGRDDHGTVAAF